MSTVDDAIPLPTEPIKPIVMSQEKADVSKVYKSPFNSCLLIFPNGKPASFYNHRFVTNVASEIEFLDAEIVRGNQGLYIDPDDYVVASQVDLLAGLKAQWEKEFRENLAKATSGEKQLGESKPDANLGMANSNTLGALAAGSASGMQSPAPVAPVLGIKIK